MKYKILTTVFFIIFALLITGGLYVLWSYNFDKSLSASIVTSLLWFFMMFILYCGWYVFYHETPDKHHGWEE